MTNCLSSNEIRRFNQSVIHNFDLSVIMPFYNRYQVFKSVLANNQKFLKRNNIEVIIIIDSHDDGDKLIDLVKLYPFINWKLIINDKEHEPRNPAAVINVGIRNAANKYILVSDPEVEFYSDVVFQLRTILEYYPNHYAIGSVAFVETSDIINENNISNLWFLKYGSIMVEKSAVEQIGGYDESFKVWGGEDDNLRRRLDMIGIRPLYVPEAKSLHREEKLTLNERLIRTKNFPSSTLRKIYFPNHSKVNEKGWGNEFNRCIYDWKNNIYAEELCYKYLSTFEYFEIKNTQIFSNFYEKIILCQSYNEIDFISGFLENMSKYFEGIILLDDGSTDGTYENANHEKILMKVKKKRCEFNDLENRNILLNISSFIKADWLCFMDIDERFDDRFANFDFIQNCNINAATFSFIDVWDTLNLYNTELPYANEGVYTRARFFSNKGNMQINTAKKKLHFAAVPVRNNIFNSNILVKHLGNLTLERRIAKYNFYMREDKFEDQKDYNYLLNQKPNLKKISEISLARENNF